MNPKLNLKLIKNLIIAVLTLLEKENQHRHNRVHTKKTYGNNSIQLYGMDNDITKKTRIFSDYIMDTEFFK